jgi:ElaB/YqjD/DUF883 family membrane-anchored ribosome-binding protein
MPLGASLHFLTKNTCTLNGKFRDKKSINLSKRDKDFEARAEASLGEIRRDLDKKIDQIKAELKEKGPEAAEAIEKSLDALKADLEGKLSDIHQSIDDQLEVGRREIRKQPLMAVGVAALVGVVVGVLLGRKCKD